MPGRAIRFRPCSAFGLIRMLSTLLALVSCASPRELAVPPQHDLIISGITVINPGLNRSEDFSIVIRDGIIREVRPRTSTDPEPICRNCYAVPGLIDAHVHTPPRIAIGNQELFALLYLAYGVTSVRDVGASEDSVADLANRLNAGDLVGPRMFRCGPVLDGDPPGWPIARVIRSAQDGISAVRELANDGVDCIKVYNEIGQEAFEGISKTAREYDLPLVGHVPHAVGLERVFDFEAQHLTGLPYLSRPRPPIGWDIRNEDVLALSDAEIDRALEVALHNRIAFTPTLANFRLRLIASDPERFAPTEGARFLPDYWARVWNLIAGHPTTEREIELQLEALPAMRSIVRRAGERGIDILAGTDTLMPWVVPGEALHLELAELREALGSVEAALASATTINGRHIARGRIGVIAPDAFADILLLRGDPMVELSALREWQILIANGRRYDRSLLDEWRAEYQRHFHNWFQRAVMGPIAAIATGLFSAD